MNTKESVQVVHEDAELNVVLHDVLDAIKGLEADESPDYSFLLSHSNDAIAQVIESVPPPVRAYIWAVLTPERYWPVLLELQLDTAGNLVDSLGEPDRLRLQETASPHDLIALANVLPDEMVSAIILEQESGDIQDIQQALAYDEDQVGRYLNKNFLVVRLGFTAGDIAAKLKKNSDLVSIFVVSRAGEFKGYVPVKDLLLAEPSTKASSLYLPVKTFDHKTDLAQAAIEAQIEEAIDWYPVFAEGQLIGAVSVWELMSELQDQSLNASLREAPANEEDLFTPISQAAKMRGVWLTINLLTAFLASWVIGWFEATIAEVVALAILMPVVASMGGIAGSQTLAVALRGLTLNSISNANIKLVLWKESKIALLNGAILGVVVAVVVTAWFGSAKLGMIILCAIVANSLAAASSGTVIPFVLKKMKIDPAVSASVILTTVTDVVGFFIFLSLASIVF